MSYHGALAVFPQDSRTKWQTFSNHFHETNSKQNTVDGISRSCGVARNAGASYVNCIRSECAASARASTGVCLYVSTKEWQIALFVAEFSVARFSISIRSVQPNYFGILHFVCCRVDYYYFGLCDFLAASECMCLEFAQIQIQNSWLFLFFFIDKWTWKLRRWRRDFDYYFPAISMAFRSNSNWFPTAAAPDLGRIIILIQSALIDIRFSEIEIFSPSYSHAGDGWLGNRVEIILEYFFSIDGECDVHFP